MVLTGFALNKLLVSRLLKALAGGLMCLELCSHSPMILQDYPDYVKGLFVLVPLLVVRLLLTPDNHRQPIAHKTEGGFGRYIFA